MNLETITIQNREIYGPRLFPKLSCETDKSDLCFFIGLFKSFFENESEIIKSKIFEHYVEENLKNNYKQVLKRYFRSLNGQQFNFVNFINDSLSIFFPSSQLLF